jgi:hypothetical protein
MDNYLPSFPTTHTHTHKQEEKEEEEQMIWAVISALTPFLVCPHIPLSIEILLKYFGAHFLSCSDLCQNQSHSFSNHIHLLYYPLKNQSMLIYFMVVTIYSPAASVNYLLPVPV